MTYSEADMRKMLEAKIEVYEVKDPNVTRERYEERDRFIKWIIEQIELGPIAGGTRKDTPMTCFGNDWDAISSAVRMRDGNKCVICDKDAYEVHHIRPRFLKGKNHPRNLVCLCRECHDEVHRRIDQGIDAVIKASLDLSSYLYLRDKAVISSLDSYQEYQDDASSLHERACSGNQGLTMELDEAYNSTDMSEDEYLTRLRTIQEGRD